MNKLKRITKYFISHLVFYFKRLFKLVGIAIGIMGGIFLIAFIAGLMGLGAGRVAGSLVWLLEALIFISFFVWLSKKLDQNREK